MKFSFIKQKNFLFNVLNINIKSSMNLYQALLLAYNNAYQFLTQWIGILFQLAY